MSDAKQPGEFEGLIFAVAEEGSSLLEKFSTLVEQSETGLNSSELADYQTKIARHLLVQMAAVMPLASLGTCHCGHDVRYKGRPGALYVCCTGLPEHCWKIA